MVSQNSLRIGAAFGGNQDAELEGVFVIGCPRSGTSALAWALAQHPRFWTSDESDFLYYLFAEGTLRSLFDKCISRPGGGWLSKQGVSYQEFCSYLGRGISELFSSRSRGRVWVDQTPGYALLLDDLALLFPAAKFLHILRDGRHVVASMLASGFDEPWAKDAELAWQTWIHFVDAGLRAEASWPSRVMRVYQGRMRSEPESLMQEVCWFLGVEYDNRPARFLRENTINSSFEQKKDSSAPPRPRCVDPPASLAQTAYSLLSQLNFV